MHISKPKLIAIFVVIIIVLFENTFLNSITISGNEYTPRRMTGDDYELPDNENDYNMTEYALAYLTEFLTELQKNPKEAVSKYVDKDCYNVRIKENEEKFMRELNDKIIISDTENNEHSVRIYIKI